jgi:hypothetical protein
MATEMLQDNLPMQAICNSKQMFYASRKMLYGQEISDDDRKIQGM